MTDNEAREYTPTTEQVRAGFAEDPAAEYNNPVGYSTRPAERAFDRWLAAHSAKLVVEFMEQPEFKVMLDAAKAEPLTIDRDRSDLWTSLDWMLWGVGMGDTVRESLADKMISALSDEEFAQAEALILDWNERRGGPIERNLFAELKAERDEARAATAKPLTIDRDALVEAMNAADVDYSAREQRADAGGGEMEPSGWFTFIADAVIAHLAAGVAPRISERQVWQMAQFQHDFVLDSNNVPAFVEPLLGALRAAGIPFDEEPFIDGGFLLPAALASEAAADVEMPSERVHQLIHDLTDPGECWFDHHGGCQEHGYLSLKPGELCPHAEAKQLLAKWEPAKDGLDG